MSTKLYRLLSGLGGVRGDDGRRTAPVRLASVGLSVAVTAAVLVPMTAAVAQPSSFVAVDGNIRQVGGSFDWGNSGTAYATCGNGGIDAVGSNGLFNCGRANGTGTPFPPVSTLSAAQLAANGITSEAFFVDPLYNSTVKDTGITCATSPFAASTGGDSTTFTSGADKNDNPLNGFTYGAGSLQPKDDIGNVYAIAHHYTDGSGTQHSEVFFGGERVINNGASHFDFEFLQQGISLVSAPTSDPCAGTFSGHRAEGDLLMTVDFGNGGALGSKTIYKWECTGAYTGPGSTSAQNPAIGTVCDPGNGLTAQYVAEPATQQAKVSLVVNGGANPIACGGWVCRDEEQTDPTKVSQNEFMEGGVDLGDLGFAGGCVNTFLPHTRSSPDINSTLSDFAGPLGFNTCNVTTTAQSSATNSNFTNLAASPPAPTVPVGSWLRDTAVASGFTGQAGSVSFTLYGPLASYPADNNHCPTTPIAFGPNTKTAPANTQSPASFTSDGFQPTSAGNYLWVARYSSPGITAAEATSDCTTEEVTVTKAQPQLTTSLSSSSILNTASVTDTATLSNATSGASGAITISVYSGNDANACVSGNLVTSQTATPATNGNGNYSATFSGLAAGSYEFQASIAADGSNFTASSVCGTEPLTVQNQPTLTTLLSSDHIASDGTATDTATLSGATSDASGVITISVYSGNDATACVSGNLVTSQTATPTTNGNGDYTASFSGLAAGSYEFQATIAADAKNRSAVSACGTEPLGVKNQPTLTTLLSSSSILNTASVTDTATLSGATSDAAGAITITVYSGNDATACVAGNLVTSQTATPATNGNGDYTATFSGLAAGSYEFQATIAADAKNKSASSACGSEPLTVQNQPALTTLLSSSSILNTASVTDTATLSGATSDASGAITITVYSGSDATACVAGNVVTSQTATPATNGNGDYTATFSGLAAGSYEFQATIAADAKNKSASSACGTEPLTVQNQPTLTTLLSSSSILNTASVTDTATLSGATSDASGAITITVYSGSDATACVAGNIVTSQAATPATNGNGDYTATFSGLAAGSYEFQATIAADAKNKSASSACGTEPLTVTNQPTLTTLLSASTITAGNPVTDTATLSGATADASGTITITAYSGTDATACVAGNIVTSQLATPATSGNGDYTATFNGLAAGSYEFQASIAADSKNRSATSACGTEPLTVSNQPTLTTQLSSSSILNTASVTDTATLSGATSDASGAITISVYAGTDGTACSGAVITSQTATPGTNGNGDYSATFSGLAAGSYEFQAFYAGDGKNHSIASTCGTEPLTVQNQPALTTLLSSSSILNTASVTDTASLSGATSDASGAITITVYSGSDATACVAGNIVTSQVATPATNGNGDYTATFSGLAAGSYEFQATIAADAKNRAASSACGTEPLTVTNQPALTTLLSSSSILNTASVTDTATLSGATSDASGAITITVYSGSDATACVAGNIVTSQVATPATNGNGDYTATFSGLAAGSYEFQAKIAADAKNRTASSACGTEPLTVQNQPALTTLLSSSSILNTASVTDTATLTGATSDATGAITISVYAGTDGTACSGAVITSQTATPGTNGNGDYTATFSGLAAGSYEFQAFYAGDGKNKSIASTCGTEPLTVQNQPALTTLLSSSSILNTASVTDTATLTGATSDASGAITITVYSGSDATACVAGNIVTSQVATPATNGNGAYSATFSGLVAGSYEFQASIAADSKNRSASSACGTEPLTVKNQPTLTTQLSSGSIGTTDTVTDTATLSGSTADSTGVITISVYTGSTSSACVSGNLVTSRSATPATGGDGSYSASFGPLAAGNYEFQASYAGDGKNRPATSACGTEPLTVTNPHTSQITPTQTTCSQFQSGTAATLGQVQYSVKGKNISQVNPGVFFYWVKVTAVAGSNTFTVNQSITTGNFSTLFTVASGSNAYDQSCASARSVSITQSSNGSVVTVSFNGGTTGGTFFIGIKFSTTNVVGKTAPNPSTVSYQYSTTGVAGSTSGLDLVKKK
jgi:hypothetical protein